MKTKEKLHELFKIYFVIFNILIPIGAAYYWYEILQLPVPINTFAKAGGDIGDVISNLFMLIVWAIGAVIIGFVVFITKDK